MATRSQLKNRWKGPPWSERNEAIHVWCVGEQHLDTQGLPQRSPNDPQRLWPLLNGLPYREEVVSGWDVRASKFCGAYGAVFDGLDASYCGGSAASYGGAIDLTNCAASRSRFDYSGPWYGVSGSYGECSFRGAKMNRAWLMRGPFTECCFDDAKMPAVKTGSRSMRIDFRGSSFRRAMLRRAELTFCDLRGCDFTDADLTGANLVESVIDATTVFRGATLVDVMTVWDTGPPETHSRVDLSVAQTDERTQISEHDIFRSPTVWRPMLSAIMHHLKLPEWRDKRWAPIVREVVERTRQELKGPKADFQGLWTEELRTRIDPADHEEAQAFLEDATTKGM